MIGSNGQLSLGVRRKVSEESEEPAIRARKLRVVQLGSYPAQNRGARSNILTIHERLQARGHESVVIDLTRGSSTKVKGVHHPVTLTDLASLLISTSADVVHLHFGSALTWRKLALAAALRFLPEAKKVCTLHLGGHFYPRKGLRARQWGITAAVLRQFDALIAINPEIARFFQEMGVGARQTHLITPFPRLRSGEAANLPDELEDFCRRHTPIVVSAGRFEPGSDLPRQFEMLSMVRERYPSTGLIAAGEGSLHFKYMYERALHKDSNHIELPGALEEQAIGELVKRANAFLRSGDEEYEEPWVREALAAGTPIVTQNIPGSGELPQLSEVEAGALQILRSLQVPRVHYDEGSPALNDGVDDVIRLYRQIVPKPPQTVIDSPAAAAAYEWPSIGWGL